MNLFKALSWLAGAVFAAILLWWAGPKLFGEKLDPRSQEWLGRIAAEINRTVPVMIDKETELTIVEGHEGMLIYKYRLVPYSVKQLDHQKFAAGVKQKVAQGACNQPDMRDNYLKKGVTLRYSYFDRDKQHIATVDVTPADCGF
ncbi:MAG: hypothetical protein EXR70_24795 [Deltaproteobacteria bacterium]|nr:hypothetical protein [Deltaproteobacteria bacterium]